MSEAVALVALAACLTAAVFVLDHAPCRRVLIVWAGPPPGLDTLRLPPHLRS